jgi:hypothetical protein
MVGRVRGSLWASRHQNFGPVLQSGQTVVPYFHPSGSCKVYVAWEVSMSIGLGGELRVGDVSSDRIF